MSEKRNIIENKPSLSVILYRFFNVSDNHVRKVLKGEYADNEKNSRIRNFAKEYNELLRILMKKYSNK